MAEPAPSVLPAHQRRSVAARDRLIDAATELLAEAGWEGFTVAEVSRRAGVAVGSVYQRVPNKAALVRAVNERATERFMARHDRFADGERWRALATPRLIDEAVAELVEHFRGDEALLRALIRRAAADPQLAERGAIGVAELGAAFQDLLLTRRDEIAHRDPKRAAGVVYRQLFATLAWRVAWGEQFEAPQPLGWEELAAELAATTRAYLLSSEGGESEARPA